MATFISNTAGTTIESSSGAAGRSAERERRLREHPHAKVLGPQAVECGLCKKEIRLSTKSAYDPFHWTKHIDRCAKLTPAERAARVERTNKTADRRKRSSIAKEVTRNSPVPKQASLTIRLRAKRSSSASSQALPSLRDESANEQADDSISSPPPSNSSPLPDTPSPPSELRQLTPELSAFDQLMEDYYVRSRRRCRREMDPFTIEDATAWSWSMVKEPAWVTTEDPSSQFGTMA